MVRVMTYRSYDDLDGQEVDDGGGTVHFCFEGRAYEIDLRAENVEEMRRLLSRYTSHGRPAQPPPEEPVDGREVRAWAQQQGLEVAPLGRLASQVVEQYRRAREQERATAEDADDASAAGPGCPLHTPAG